MEQAKIENINYIKRSNFFVEFFNFEKTYVYEYRGIQRILPVKKRSY
jgi:hypothetical protein